LAAALKDSTVEEVSTDFDGKSDVVFENFLPK